jgi:hypothetical protein
MISIDRFCAVVRRCAVCQATTGQWSTRRKQATNHWTNNSQGLVWMPNFPSNFTIQKEDFLSYQNVGTCMEY